MAKPEQWVEILRKEILAQWKHKLLKELWRKQKQNESIITGANKNKLIFYENMNKGFISKIEY